MEARSGWGWGVQTGAHDGAEVLLALRVLADVVAEWDEAGAELLRLEAPVVVAVEVLEAAPELVHLLVRDALRVARQDLRTGTGTRRP